MEKLALGEGVLMPGLSTLAPPLADGLGATFPCSVPVWGVQGRPAQPILLTS